MSHTPCCRQEAKHQDCQEHEWESQLLNAGTPFEQSVQRCRICHVNREWWEARR